MAAYDVTKNSWTSAADMSAARSGLAAVSVNGKIYATAGQASGGVVSTVEVYDPPARVGHKWNADAANSS